MCQLGEVEYKAESSSCSQNKGFSASINNDYFSGRSKKPNNHVQNPETVKSISDCAYRPDPALEVSSLSMRLMHRPSRAQNEFEKASDPTKQNSLLNSILPNNREDDILSSSEARSPSDYNSVTSSPDALREKDHPRHNLVRKKSGEIVKSLLKDNGTLKCVRPSSLPATPTFKQVHFGGNTDVRYFKKKDRPAAISASNSPRSYEEDEDDDLEIPSLESDLEATLTRQSLFDPSRKSYFDYYDEELNSHIEKSTDLSNHAISKLKIPPVHDWQLSPSNFPVQNNQNESIRSGKEVFLESIFVSADKRYLLGQVAVLNLAYEKSVIVRYSLDSWFTIIEIQATYIPDTPLVLKTHNYDRFMFKIPLDSFVNGFHSSVDPLSNSPTELCPELCVKYTVNGEVLWDNNNEQNYLFILKKVSAVNLLPKVIPEMARTKQEAHEKRPKYSSSYLKRIKSDTDISRKQTDFLESPNQLKSTKSSRAVTESLSNESPNDFESNNFYLSSPLFSSLARSGEVINSRGGTPQKPLTESESFTLDQPKMMGNPNKIHNVPTRHFLHEADSVSLARMSKDLKEPISYKDFLDSYCFFNPNFKENCSRTTLVMSDSPSINDNDVAIDRPGKKPIQSVSTFLA